MSTEHRENKLNFSLDVAGIGKLATELVEHSKQVYDAVVAIPDADRTFDNTVRVLALEEDYFDTLGSSCVFPAHVHPDKELRDASSASEETLQAFEIESGMREDLYLAVKAYDAKRKAANEELGYEENRFLEKTLNDFRRNGLHLPAAERDEIKALQQKMSVLCIQFQKNLNEDKTEIVFESRDDLAGLDDDFINGLKRDGDKYIVTLKYPELFPVLKKAKVEETRKRMEFANASKCMEANTPLLEEVLGIRQDLAKKLGYETHADYTLEVRMAKKAETVLSFEKELQEKLRPYAAKELQELLDLKEVECKNNNVPFDGKINGWDFQYYHTLLIEKEYEVNDDEAKVYFPMQKVTDGLLKIYQEMLGLRFVEAQGSKVWHEDVRMFEVFDSAEDYHVGQFYLDLFPREGKYGHAAVFPLQRGTTLADGGRQFPVCAMVANFSKPTEDKPSLLKHNEVVTYFHEFGHVMHGICTKAKIGRFAGTRTERDFVEAPSQMLENWCWEEQSLKLMSGHYKDLSDPLPDVLLNKMIKAKNVHSGLLNLRQIFFGMYDMTVHTSAGKVDSAALWGKLRTDITLVESTPGTNPAAGFGHIMGGYDAGYYGYLWSQVFSADMFKVFKDSGNLLCPELGMKYRKEILEIGGTRDGDVMIRRFLGREPTQDAFLQSIGIKQ